MRIVRVEHEVVALGLIEPYTIAYQTFEHASNVFVQLITDGPHVGLGCAAPDATVTGEAVEASAAGIDAVRAGLEGADPLRRMAVLDAIGPHLAGLPAARAAVDMALLDLVGKAAALPVWQLLGGFRPAIPTSITVAIDAPDAMVRTAQLRCEQGFRALKLKGGRDPAQDADIVRRVRAAVGPRVAIRFDANQGYDLDAAAIFLAGVAEADLELLEQPTPRGQAGQLGRISRAAPVPVMADESLHDLRDALRLARGEVVDMLNIKLMKVGGLEAALAVNAVGLAAGLEVMVGCMDESEIAIAAGLHFALARPNVTLADLDGHLELASDPGRGAVRLEDGLLRPADAPGLGLRRFAL